MAKKKLRRQRERAEKCIEELIANNFSLEDILFAVEWTIENSKEKLYDFSIITHTISQAMTEKEKIENRKAESQRRERIALEKKAEEEKAEKETARIESYKG